ncbi:MAG: DUF58 domain-containing protein [Chloroflexi bacterium]|nr:DUF58 domain-containing protein [Chloroflexota bacterium]MDA1146783.1 DUF58 domain-containing protein [Chloroflexota bacterium]MQC82847.1 DUF58 domain-containing protein [Chloroflexota bacterium]PKB56619.1 MAG: hypothetical protein BZY69_00780 [SAR202 cluster bacterium Casp-Chloro-G1]
MGIGKLVGVIRRYPSAAIALSLGVVCVVLGFATGFWLLFRLAYIVAVAVPALYFWTRSMSRGLEVEVLRKTHRVTQGQNLEGRVIIRSRSRLPKLWLEVEDQSSVPNHAARRVVTLGAHGVATWNYATPARLRGLYELGPLRIIATDPFGFFRMEREFGQTASVLVYPNAPELPNFYIPPANLPGEGRFRRRTHNVTPNVSGIREYAPGDSFNRIHWPATARAGRPMVKQFELDPASDIWIVLDLQRSQHVGSGEDSTEEGAVQICASIARYFINANRSVGMISFGSDLRIDEPDRGQNHYTRILESLALARATGDVPLTNLIIEESRRFGRHTTVVVVTPSTDTDWALTLTGLSARGVKVAAVLLEANTYGEAPSALDVYSTLAAGGVYSYTVKHQDDLGRALGAGAERAIQQYEGARP